MSLKIDPAAVEAVRTSIRRLLADEGVGPLPFRVPDQLLEGWRAAVKICGEDFALRIASEMPVGSFGRSSFAFASAASLRGALEVFCRDTQRAIDGCRAELVEKGPVARVSLRGNERMWPIFELLLALIALRCRQLVDPPLLVSEVGLPIPKPAQPELWTTFFGVRPHFGLDHGYLALPAPRLGQPLRTTDPAVRATLGAPAASSTIDAVRAHVREWVGESPNVDDVARALGVAPRTLQRRLREEGTSFREVFVGVRIDVAKELLERADMTISEVATAVGFAGVAAFSQAFSQRTGKSPSTYRAARFRK